MYLTHDPSQDLCKKCHELLQNMMDDTLRLELRSGAVVKIVNLVFVKCTVLSCF